MRSGKKEMFFSTCYHGYKGPCMTIPLVRDTTCTEEGCGRDGLYCYTYEECMINIIHWIR
jgi:hypothetical protein